MGVPSPGAVGSDVVAEALALGKDGAAGVPGLEAGTEPPLAAAVQAGTGGRGDRIRGDAAGRPVAAVVRAQRAQGAGRKGDISKLDKRRHFYFGFTEAAQSYQPCRPICYRPKNRNSRSPAMSTPTTQIPIEFKGSHYSGVYSVSGSLLIARVPGVSSRSAELTGDEEETARSLCNTILEEADSAGLL